MGDLVEALMTLVVVYLVACAAWLLAVKIAKPGPERWTYIVVGGLILLFAFWVAVGTK